MKRKTTTLQINEALKSNLLKIEKAECYHKTTHQTDPIDTESFLKDFQFLVESSIFTDCIGWYFEKIHKTNQYITECCRLDGGAENIITVYLHPNENVKIEDIDRTLLYIED